MAIIRGLTLALALAGLAGHASAGAWPREEGSLFVSSLARLSWPQDVTTWTSYEPTGEYYTLYVEYGLTERLTVGLDLGRAISGGGKDVAFLRMPLGRADRRLKLAAELGLGQIEGAMVLRPGLSLGLGFRHGWLSADGLAEISLGSGETDYKLDLTWGLNLWEERKLIVQFQTGQQFGDPAFVRIEPTIVQPLTKRLKTQIGGSYGLLGDTSMGLTFGLWAEF